MAKELVSNNCKNCLLHGVYCRIEDMLQNDHGKWEIFSKECGKLDPFKRIVKVDAAHLNKIDRKKIMDEIFPFFFPPSFLVIPIETVRRVLVDKWAEIFPEFSSEPQTSNYYKWALRLDVINKFCQLAETLGAHLLAAKAIGDKYDNFDGYVSEIVEYNVSDVVTFYQNISRMKDEDLSWIMAYPDIAKQSEKGRRLLEESIFYLKADLSVIAEEYLKFKELYNSYKHGCRLLFPEDIEIEGAKFVACVTFFTKKSSLKRGGIINMMGFTSEDFSSFFNLIEEINQILFVLIENRKERYLISKGLTKECSVSLYFSPYMKNLYGKNGEPEFVI